MRTTIDIPDDLLHIAKGLARDRRQTLGRTVADLMRLALEPKSPARITISPLTGLPVLHTGGRVITTEDVRAIDDEEDEYLASFIRPRVATERNA